MGRLAPERARHRGTVRAVEVLHVAADGMLLAALIRMWRNEYEQAQTDLKVAAGLATLWIVLVLL